MSDERLLAQVGALIDARAYDQGLSLVGPYLVSNPADVEALCLAARAELGCDHPARAYELAARAASLAPTLEWPLRLVSISLLRQDQFVAAVRAAADAVRLAPEHWQTHYQLAAAYHRSPGGASAAWPPIQEALRLAPDQPSVHRLAGAVLAATHRTGAARASFERALALDPQDAVARHELARLSFRRWNLTGAARGFGDAVALDPRLGAGARNIDLVVAQLFRAVVLVLFLASALFTGSGSSRALRLIVIALVTLIMVAALGWFWHRVRTRLGSYLRSLPAREPLSLVLATLTVAAWACLWVAAALPAGGSAGAWAGGAGLCAVAAFLVLIIWLRRRGNLRIRRPRRRLPR